MRMRRSTRCRSVLATAFLAAASSPGDVAHAAGSVASSTSAAEFWSGLAATTLGLLALYAFRLARQVRLFAASNAELKRRLLADPLTGVENRTHLEKRLEQQFSAPDDARGLLGVCHVELEQFKSVTRTLGHKAGDDALRIVAGRLCGVFGPESFIARVGGDEFIVVVSHLRSAAELERLAGKVVEQLGAPVWLGAHQRSLGAAVGVAVRDESVASPERLLMNADLALFDAQRARKDRFRLYSDSARTDFETREHVLNEIHAALREDAFIPFFQPQIDAVTGRHIGFEALARWRHPTRGVLAPAHFLSVAVESGLIEQIGAMILRKSLQALSRWKRAGFDPPRLGLNFSAEELRDPGFLDKLQWDLELLDVSPDQISIEILESVLIDQDDDPAVRNVTALAQAGYCIDLDDFGTGHAAISNLQKFKVDRLKIDRSFVREIDTDPSQRKLADAILYMANTLGLETIAEGVETRGEMQSLIEMGCVNQQGYLHGAPMSEDDCLVWMAECEVRQNAVARAAGAPRRSA